MTIKSKKILLSSLAILSGGLFLVSASCGGSRKFDQTEQKKIKILLGWRKRDPQFKALTEIIKVYNETQKDTADFLPVETDTDEGSYGAVFKKLSNGLQTKDASNFWNLTFHYPVSVAQLEGYNMRLRFDKNDKNNDNYGITREDIESAFINFNDNISGVPRGEISAIPLAKSTIITSINAPIISYVLESMETLGTKISPKSKEWYEKLKNAGKADREYIKNLWGEVSTEITEAEKQKYKDFTFDLEDVFNNGSKLIDFAIMAQQLFTKSRNTTGGVSILGITDPAGFYSTQIYSQVAKNKNDYKNYHIALDDNGFVHYDNIFKPDRPAYKAVKNISDKIIEAAKVGAIYYKSRPSYQLRQHRIGIGIGSTSSYSEHYSPSGQDVFTLHVDKSGKTVNTNVDERSINFVSGAGDDSKNILLTTKSVTIFNSTDDAELKKLGRNFKSTDAPTDANIKEFLGKLITTTTTKDNKEVVRYTDGAIVKDENFDEIWKNDAARAKLEADGITKLGSVLTWNTSDEKTIVSDIYGVPKWKTIEENKSLGYVQGTSTNTVQENEFFQHNSPRKWAPENEMNAVYLQGPSLIGIHANEKSNKATRKFIQWLVSADKHKFRFYNGALKGDESEKFQYKILKDGKEEFTESSENAIEYRPLRYLFEASSYLSPYKNFFTDVTNPKNPFAKIAFKEFVKGETEKDYFVLEEPADALADNFRDAFNTALRVPVNQYYDGSGSSVKGNYEDDILKPMKLNAGNFGVFV